LKTIGPDSVFENINIDVQAFGFDNAFRSGMQSCAINPDFP